MLAATTDPEITPKTSRPITGGTPTRPVAFDTSTYVWFARNPPAYVPGPTRALGVRLTSSYEPGGAVTLKSPEESVTPNVHAVQPWLQTVTSAGAPSPSATVTPSRHGPGSMTERPVITGYGWRTIVPRSTGSTFPVMFTNTEAGKNPASETSTSYAPVGTESLNSPPVP